MLRFLLGSTEGDTRPQYNPNINIYGWEELESLSEQLLRYTALVCLHIHKMTKRLSQLTEDRTRPKGHAVKDSSDFAYLLQAPMPYFRETTLLH